MFICSVPNVKRYLFPKTIPHDHVREFLPNEFRELIGGYFSDVKLYGQKEFNLLKKVALEMGERLLPLSREKIMKSSLMKLVGEGDWQKEIPIEEAKRRFANEIADPAYVVSTFRDTVVRTPECLVATAKKKLVRPDRF